MFLKVWVLVVYLRGYVGHTLERGWQRHTIDYTLSGKFVFVLHLTNFIHNIHYLFNGVFIMHIDSGSCLFLRFTCSQSHSSLVLHSTVRFLVQSGLLWVHRMTDDVVESSLNQLIYYCTSKQSGPANELMNQFCLTIFTYCTPKVFLGKLMDRFELSFTALLPGKSQQ